MPTSRLPLDARGAREYFEGGLKPEEIARLAANRREKMGGLWDFWKERSYLLFRVPDDATLRPATTLDEPDSPGEMNFLALPQR